MNKSFHLSLLIGPAIPVPAPRFAIEALTSVEVTTASGSRATSGFKLQFSVSKRSPLHTIFLLSAGSPLPILRVIVLVTINGTPDVLIDGVVNRQDMQPGSDGNNGTLTVMGTDLTAAMNLIPFDGFPFPAMPEPARAALIIAKYAMFGMIPMVIPPLLMDIPLPTDYIPRQQGTDLQYLYAMADSVGYVFYLDPGPAPGTNVAYWGPEVKVGIPQPALNLDMDAHTNVEALNFNFDAESKTLPILFIHNQMTKVPIPIPVPDITPLQPPLGLVPALPKHVELLTDTAKLSPLAAAQKGLALASRSSDVVTANGSLDVLRYGRPLKARKLVGVRGAGEAFDGLYFVKSVTHKIKRGEYKQDFSLSRNGLLSTVPRVPA